VVHVVPLLTDIACSYYFSRLKANREQQSFSLHGLFIHVNGTVALVPSLAFYPFISVLESVLILKTGVSLRKEQAAPKETCVYVTH